MEQVDIPVTAGFDLQNFVGRITLSDSVIRSLVDGAQYKLDISYVKRGEDKKHVFVLQVALIPIPAKEVIETTGTGGLHARGTLGGTPELPRLPN